MVQCDQIISSPSISAAHSFNTLTVGFMGADATSMDAKPSTVRAVL